MNTAVAVSAGDIGIVLHFRYSLILCKHLSHLLLVCKHPQSSTGIKNRVFFNRASMLKCNNAISTHNSVLVYYARFPSQQYLQYLVLMDYRRNAVKTAGQVKRDLLIGSRE